MLLAARVDEPYSDLGRETDLRLSNGGPSPEEDVAAYLRGMEHLVGVVQELSLARDLQTVMDIVRKAARTLAHADGATFVLRDGQLCFYADEYAIAPLWKGRRFPMTSCISGWSMIHREQVVIEDIYRDERIPAEAYRPTFVKSLVMVPIRTSEPLGAIGTYWAEQHLATGREVKLLQALADSTSVALENVQLYQDLEQRVRERTAELEVSNRELEAFSYSVSHDLRAPLRSIIGFNQALMEDHATRLDEDGRECLQRVAAAGQRMSHLIDDLLQLSRVTRTELSRAELDLSALCTEVLGSLQRSDPDRTVSVSIDPEMRALGDGRLLRIVLENLLGNAWKFTSRKTDARISVTAERMDTTMTIVIADNGAGFDMAYANKLFTPFQRLHSPSEFPGTGVGLATVQRIIRRHGGTISAESKPGQGATFRFSLPASRILQSLAP
ncbi:MAG TPA: ATP-binding protein [Polyangiaceae bacterium]